MARRLPSSHVRDIFQKVIPVLAVKLLNHAELAMTGVISVFS